jgi:DNA-binding NarL/FixJ family response regulator
MPRASGLETLRLLSSDQFPTKTIVLTAAIGRNRDRPGRAARRSRSGLEGRRLTHALRQHHGRRQREFWLGSQRLPDQEKALRKALADGGQETGDFDLSPREREIIVALAEGMSNRDIAERFKLSEVTVKHHLNSIFDKCGVSNRLELALFALRHGLARL